MGFKAKYHIDVDFEVPKKIPWYYAIFFASFWFILYLAIVLSYVTNLPKPLMLKDEARNPQSFIAERAERTLLNLTLIGPRVVGSVANEQTTIEFLTQEVLKIQAEAHEKFDFDIDVQEATGNYVHWTMINMYQSVQNFIVKLSIKGSTNENYLLINSHFDSVPGGVGAGDDGSMVATMLEVMRVISKDDNPLEHPIIFLFNGAEENPLQASHGFITQHKWAKNCKALINLDSAGSGGREILFQSGPNHPWLMKYYRDVPHPFATTMGEEIFQADLIPSDTDFRIFRDYGGVPGLDMAYIFNGYVYHTEYDRIKIFPKGSFQHTGDNVLSLAKALANAYELDDTAAYEEGHNIFFDFLGWGIIFYTLTTSIIVNVVVCAIAFTAIAVSLYFMAKRSGLGWMPIFRRYGICFSVQVVSLCLAAGLTLLVAAFMDGVGRSMTWFYSNWLIIGLYFCPMFFGMAILPAFYLEKTKTDPLSLGFRIQLFQHSHCLFLIVLTLVATIIGLRSSFMCMMAVLFDISALIINLITKWHRKAYWFAIAAMFCQFLPFVYYTYVAHATYLTIIPMTGRSGSDGNPDITIAFVAIFMTFLFAGFIMPLFMFFRKTRTIISAFLGITLLFIIIAVTPAGFPYEPTEAAQRFSLLHVHRRLHNADNSLRTDEAGIFVYPQDRRVNSADDLIEKIGTKHKVSEYCDDEVFCGMPLYNHRWHKAREASFWVPIDELPNIPDPYPILTLSSREADSATLRYNFILSGPDHMTLFIDPKDGATIKDWSFNETMIKEKWDPPFFIYFSYGKDNRSLEFTIELENPKFDAPNLEIGIGGHWIHQDIKRTDKYQEFIDSFPEYATVTDWVATFESWLF